MPGPITEEPVYVNRYGTPKGTPPKISPPTVRVEQCEGIPSVQVLDAGERVLDLSCVDALNLAMLLIEAAGDAQATRIDAMLTQQKDVTPQHERTDTIAA